MEKKWLRPDEVAAWLQISRRSAYRLCSEGHFIAMKVRGSLRIRMDSVEAYIARQVALHRLETGYPEVPE